MSSLGVTALTDVDGNNSVAQSVIYSGTAKAWSNVNGDTTVERDSYGLSSYTDNGTGDTDYNLSITMSDANYGFTGGGGDTDTAQMTLCNPHSVEAPTATSIRLQAAYANGTLADFDLYAMSIQGGLA